MKILLFAVITCAFISLACSITCYQCVPKMEAKCSSYTADQCVTHQTRLTCPEGLDYCMRSRLRGFSKNASIDIEQRSCANSKTCGSLKISCEFHRNHNADLKCEFSCCDGDLCNASSRPIAHCIVLVMIACLFAIL
ncbi:hypothetical protein OS493_003652 [Desmophyllum pertusum]|uniref:Protein quiver n=1 Tax=Desmophyllum pertusum TaxID=174260 RepID=A0A9X0A5T6_9CNID|nr:hypothetical protein OS493_003652 [Desmophyllum pertusum]